MKSPAAGKTSGTASGAAAGKTAAAEAIALAETSAVANDNAALLEEANASTTTLYHGATLRDGRIQAGKFSTTPSLEHASDYAELRGGRVYRLEVPNSLFRERRLPQQIQEITDSLVGTEGAATELRFEGDFSLRLNQLLRPIE